MADAVNTIKKYLESHYSEVITRKKIEELVHLNQDHINREFKKQTGYTLMEYVQHYRILMARKCCGRRRCRFLKSVFGQAMIRRPIFLKYLKNRPNVHHWNIVRQKQKDKRFCYKTGRD